jgi:predicted metal-binding membrane protein
MSMAWMRMPGQTWLDAALAFLGMWLVMMAAMMLPALVPMLRRYREAVGGRGRPGLGRLTALAASGYFVVWGLLGTIAFLVGSVLTQLEMQHPAMARLVPTFVGLFVVGAGAFQFRDWKARQLVCCRTAMASGDPLTADARVAWRCGVCFGIMCSRCCGNLMVILLVAGVMDLQVMAGITAAITVERLAPSGQPAARSFGGIVVAVGLILLARRM